MSHKIFLVGLPGSGKTTMGLELAVHLSMQFVDLDQDIEKLQKQAITTLFETKGEAHFRQLEHLQLKNVIGELPNFVMATGGGTPCFFDNMEIMKKSGETIFIDTPIESIKRRIEHDGTRPLMKNNSLEGLFEQRKEYYLQADQRVSTMKELMTLYKG